MNKETPPKIFHFVPYLRLYYRNLKFNTHHPVKMDTSSLLQTHDFQLIIQYSEAFSRAVLFRGSVPGSTERLKTPDFWDPTDPKGARGRGRILLPPHGTGAWHRLLSHCWQEGNAEMPKLRAGHWDTWGTSGCSCPHTLTLSIWHRASSLVVLSARKFILEECYNTEINAYWGRHFLVTVLLHICAYISAGQGSDHAAKAEMWAELLEQNKGWMSCYVKHILTKDFFTLNPISPHFQMNSVIVCVHSNSKGCFTQLQL